MARSDQAWSPVEVAAAVVFGLSLGCDLSTDTPPHTRPDCLRAHARVGRDVGEQTIVTMERPARFAARGLRCELEALHNAEPHAKEPVMSNVRFIGLDVHAETIAVAVAEPDG